MGRRGPLPKAKSLDILQGGVSNRPPRTTKEPPAEIKAAAKWFEEWGAYWDRLAKEQRATSDNPSPAFWAAFKCKDKAAMIHARLMAEPEPEKPRSKWAGLITSAT